jgi:hypothetical protein
LGCLHHDSIFGDQGDVACFGSAVAAFGDMYNFCLSWWPQDWWSEAVDHGTTVYPVRTALKTPLERCWTQ